MNQQWDQQFRSMKELYERKVNTPVSTPDGFESITWGAEPEKVHVAYSWRGGSGRVKGWMW